MLDRMRWLVFALALVSLLAASDILGRLGGAFSEEPAAQSAVGRIAYVDLQGHIHTVQADGAADRQLTAGEGFFTWPTWAPDGVRLVYSGVERSQDGAFRVGLYSYNTASGHTRELYISEPGMFGLLADGVVHYPMWSPDGKRLAFIVTTSRGLTLFVDDLLDDAGASPVLDSGPLWMTWSPDSRFLLVHRDRDHFLVDTAAGPSVEELEVKSAGYRVPAWRPSGDRITVVSSGQESQSTLDLADTRGRDRLALRTVPQAPAFLWSQDGRYLAVAGSERVFFARELGALVYPDIVLLSAEGTAQAASVQGNVLAFFWSPDGARLAYATLLEEALPEVVLRWSVLEAATGESRTLADFVPSGDQFTMFQFFDQYAYSHLLWSPDSRWLVFSGNLWGGTVPASLPGRAQQEPQVVVLDSSGQSPPRAIADGFLAFWSPR